MILQAEIRNSVIRKIEEYEGRVNHLYVDSVGRVTIGVGHLVANRSTISTITLYKTNPTKTASLKEKQDDYDSVSKAGAGYAASWYKKKTTLIMTDADVNALLNKHVNEFYGYLRNIYKKSKGYPDDFDDLPKNVRLALFDMIFNLGPNKIVSVFKTFDKHLKEGDWSKAAVASNRPQVSAARNSYVQQLLSNVPPEQSKND